MIDQLLYYRKGDCDGHSTVFTYDYTGEETKNLHSYSHSKTVESWKISEHSGANFCKITKQEGNHVEYACKLPDSMINSNCLPDNIEHFGGGGTRLLLYATMKPVEAPPKPKPEPKQEEEPTPEPEPKREVPLVTQPEEPEEKTTKFVGTKRSKVYHEPECWRVKRIKDSNLIAITQAQKNKRRQCKSCD